MTSLIIYKKNLVENISLVPIVLTQKFSEKTHKKRTCAAKCHFLGQR